MKLFISWSGEPSRTVAEALRNWIPQVLQFVEPWMSQADIEAGARWGNELAEQLRDTHFGVICVTPDNQENAWLLFEAGALSKVVDRTFVCPYLIEMARPDLVRGPLLQFQAKRATKADTLALIRTIHKAGKGSLTDGQLEKAFDKWWPDLGDALAGLPAPAASLAPTRPIEEMMAEVLDVVRGIAQRIEPASAEDLRSVLATFMLRNSFRHRGGFDPTGLTLKDKRDALLLALGGSDLAEKLARTDKADESDEGK